MRNLLEKRVCLIVCLLATQAPLLTAAAAPFDEGQKALAEGREADAFQLFLTTPGAEQATMLLARPKAHEYLKILADHQQEVPDFRRKLIEGDLRLALGEKERALACYRQVAARTRARPDQGWDNGWIPADAYLVEWSPRSAGESSDWLFQQPLLPFSVGPGSHRDNWLIRRFLALDAMEDAAKEWARIWEIHRRHAEPYVRAVPSSLTAAHPASTNRWVVEPAGYEGQALQFAIDYAFFLKRRGDTNASLAILLQPVMTMDMDRNPSMPREKELKLLDASPYPERFETSDNRTLRARFPFDFSAGLSRKEYLRLSYGAFKETGQLDRLLAAIQKRIGQGKNPTRRVLARLLVHEGRVDDALAMELAYIENASFDAVSAACRRGMAYEELGHVAAAADQYEKVLLLPYQLPSLPDPDEEQMQSQMSCAMPLDLARSRSTPDRAAFQADILGRLQRLYAALGKSDLAMDTTLRQFEANAALFDNLATIQQTVERFRVAGQERRIMAWIKARAAETGGSAARANLCWVAGDEAGTIRAVAALSRESKDPYAQAVERWKTQFRQAGQKPYRALLAALVEANPKDARSRLEWLDAEGITDAAERIRAFEQLLASDALPAFPRGKGARNQTNFRNSFDLAGRLMRLYERTPASEEKIVALGFRVLEGNNPFLRPAQLLSAYRANWNQSFAHNEQVASDVLNALYVWLAHLKRPEDIARAAALIGQTGSIPLRNQVNRLLPDPQPVRVDPATGHATAYANVEVRTVGLPAGVRLLANRDDVRAMAPGTQWNGATGKPDQIWIGTSWGLVRYRERSHPEKRLDILQLPIGSGVTTFCDTPAGLYVGTRGDLFRLDEPYGEAPQLVRIPCGGAVSQLIWWSNALWVCSNGQIWRYDPRAATRQHVGSGGGLFAGCGTLWSGQAVYDPQAQAFRAIDPGFPEWNLIGASSREIWGHALVNDQLRHRPAILDPQTMRLQVVPIRNPARSQQHRNSSFAFLGEHNDKVWLAGINPDITLVYDRVKQEMTIHPGPLPETARELPGADLAGPAVAAAKLDLHGDRGPRFCAVPLPNGRLLVGNAIIREWSEDNLGYDDNGGMSHHVQDLEGGLFEIDPAKGTWRKIGAAAEQLSDFYVKKLVRDGRRLYVCSNGGVTILSLPEGQVIGRITVSDGLPSNKVEDAVRIGDKLYLACELGDEGGGLAVQDLRTGLIQVLTMADGLKSNKIKQLRAEGAKLHILYGSLNSGRAYGTSMTDSIVAPLSAAVLRRWTHTPTDERVRTFRSSVLDTATGQLADGHEVLPAADPPDLSGSPLPILGGTALCRLANGLAPDSADPVFVGGTHGLLMTTNAEATGVSMPVWPEERVVEIQSPLQQAQEEATTRPMVVTTPEALESALADSNTFYRARAAATLLGRESMASNCVPSLLRLLNDPELRTRSTAMFILTRLAPDARIIEAWKNSLHDSDPRMRAFATIALCRQGQVPDTAILREIFRRGVCYGNLPFGNNSLVGRIADARNLYEAVAPVATPDVFALLLEFPPSIGNYDNESSVFPQLGAALRRQPESARLLLAAYDQSTGGHATRELARHLFRFAGKELLPILYEALGSKDRVVRSNAARACGSIGDAGAIPHLIQALDLESGLARASIVWALGQLKAREALPHLVPLYLDARNDEKRHQGSGFLMSQYAAAVSAQYESLSHMDALASDWDELKASALNTVDPQRNEELLSPRLILDALAGIGSAAAQEFYRSMAGEKDAEARAEAAARLAECAAPDVGKNVTVLINLLADATASVRVPAAVSLLVLGQDTVAQRPLLTLLEKGNPWEKIAVVRELGRIQDPSQWEFAKGSIQSMAADRTLPDELRHQAAIRLKMRK